MRTFKSSSAFFNASSRFVACSAFDFASSSLIASSFAFAFAASSALRVFVFSACSSNFAGKLSDSSFNLSSNSARRSASVFF